MVNNSYYMPPFFLTYPKAEITELIKRYDNLHLICNVRSDTMLYDLPPKPTGKRGRPKKQGALLSLDDTFTFF